MSAGDGRFWITYNGELYNFRELRAELEQAGHSFVTSSDTEVILHAWQEWGDDCVARFRGMFAFCVVDHAERRYLLARDHFGIKPLLYAATGEALAFASEFSALRALPWLKLTGSLPAVEWFLRHRYIPAPDTIYREIRKLPPGHVLSGRLDQPAGTPKAYYGVSFEPDENETPEGWLERLETTLRDSVRAHLIADVPVGAFLSGGVDSTSVVALMKELVEGSLTAYTIGFDDPKFSELPYAEEAAGKLGVELRSDIAGEDFWDDFPSLVAHYGEPFGDNSMIPTWRLAQLARRDVPVALSGDGGDEAFGGYDHYGAFLEVPSIKQHWRRLRKKFSGAELDSFLWAIGRCWGGSLRPKLSEWIGNVRYTSDKRRRELWRDDLQYLVDGGNPAHERADAEASRCDLIAYGQSMDFRTYLPGAMLTKVDIAAMYHGLEVRTPLLDRQVIELACGMPGRVRYRVEEGRYIGKAILKDWLAKRLTPEFVNRPKQGFQIPRHQWFLPGRPGRKLLDESLATARPLLEQWFNWQGVEKTLAEHTESRDRSSGMFLLLVLALWRLDNRDVEFR